MKKGASKFFQHILPQDDISRQRGITMVFSILLASTLWFLVIINQKNHTSSFSLPIYVHNLPPNVDYITPIPKEIDVHVEGFGVDLLVQHFRFKADTIHLFYSSEKKFLLTRDYFTQIVQKSPVSTNIKALYVSPDTIPIMYEYRSQKRVKLVSRASFRMAANYQKEWERFKVNDSVSIIGPMSSLDTVDVWYTRSTEFLVSKEREEFTVPIDSQAGIKVIPTSAKIEVRSSLYTQKQVQITLKVTGLPENTSINLNQKRILLSCLVPMKDYSKLKSSYNLEIPYKSIDADVPYFIPNVDDILPEKVKIVTRTPLQISYVILERE